MLEDPTKFSRKHESIISRTAVTARRTSVSVLDRLTVMILETARKTKLSDANILILAVSNLISGWTFSTVAVCM